MGNGIKKIKRWCKNWNHSKILERQTETIKEHYDCDKIDIVPIKGCYDFKRGCKLALHCLFIIMIMAHLPQWYTFSKPNQKEN